MKHSLIKKFNICFSVFFAVLLVVISYTSYSNKKEDYFITLNAIGSNASIVLTGYCELEEIDTVEGISNNDIDIEEFLDKICRHNNVKYAYIFCPNEELTQIYYPIIYNINGKTSTDEINGKSLSKGDTVEHILTNDEKKIWNKEQEQVFYVINNDYGHTYTFLSPIYDTNKNVIAIFGIDIEIEQFYKSLIYDVAFNSAYLLAFIIIVYAVFRYLLNKKLFKPISDFSELMSDFSIENNEKIIVDEKNQNELTSIYQAFNLMSDNISQNIEEIKRLSTDKAKVDAEISLASKLQADIIPATDYETDDICIKAILEPAQIVSGDFYDYIDYDDSVVMLIADVSGKGLGAALIMSRTFELCRTYANLGYSPCEILKEVNNSIAKNNVDGYFVTLFICKYNKQNSTLTYSNAGHNVPYILNDNILPLDKSKGLIIGLFEDEEYGETTIDFNTDDVLYLYTDGVNEAENSDKQFYTTERLEEVLKSFNKKDIINQIYTDVKSFADGTSQSDDITMLSFRKKKRDLTIVANVENFEMIVGKLNEITKNEFANNFDYMNFIVAVDEAFTNVCNYAYDNNVGEVNLAFSFSDDLLKCTLIDKGKPFDPLEYYKNNYDDSQDELFIGGQGIHLINKMTDKVYYENTNECNILTLEKKINTCKEDK